MSGKNNENDIGNNISEKSTTLALQSMKIEEKMLKSITATAPPLEAFPSSESSNELIQGKVEEMIKKQIEKEEKNNNPLGVHEAYIKSLIRETKGWPNKQVTFLDISPLLCNIRSFKQCINTIKERYSESNVTHIAGIDARGFTIGCALAYSMNCGFIMIRKAGKLPPNSNNPTDSYSLLSEEYKMEYGHGQLQMSIDLFDTSTVTTPRVLLIDDLLATGGTAIAACNLLRSAGATVIEMAVLIELLSPQLNGRQKLKDEAFIDLFSLLTY